MTQRPSAQKGFLLMAYDILEVSLELIAAVKAPLPRLRQHDRNLYEQTKDATNSILLNSGESRHRAGKDRMQLLRIAAGSAGEVTTALRAAEAWGHLNREDLARSFALLDRLRAMFWRATH